MPYNEAAPKYDYAGIIAAAAKASPGETHRPSLKERSWFERKRKKQPRAVADSVPVFGHKSPVFAGDFLYPQR
jgi:hypothetical protein